MTDARAGLDPVRRLLAVLAVAGLGLALDAGPAQAAAGDVLPSDPVVRLLAVAGLAGVVLLLLGGAGLWLTRRRR